MYEVFTSPTANCQRVTMMLEMAGIAYRHQRIDRKKREQHSPEFIALNPAASVPILVDRMAPVGEQVLAQSGAILLHLAEKTGRFLPAAGFSRARTLQWFMQALTDVNPAASIYFLAHRDFPANQESKDFFAQRFFGFTRDCDRVLADRPYLAGDISIADIALYPVIEARQDLLSTRGDVPNLDRWRKAFATLPGVLKGMEIA